MKARKARIERRTNETEIALELNLDGQGSCRLKSELGFLGHMLQLFAKHSWSDLDVSAGGDVQVDDHHLTEDLGIVLGRAIGEAVGDKRGIRRYGSLLLPMDEVLLAVAIDLGGRYAFVSNYIPSREMVGQLSTEMVNHFFRSLAVEARLNLHFHFLNNGDNEHHRVEAQFKGFARSLRAALQEDPKAQGEIPSTKGLL